MCLIFGMLSSGPRALGSVAPGLSRVRQNCFGAQRQVWSSVPGSNRAPLARSGWWVTEPCLPEPLRRQARARLTREPRSGKLDTTHLWRKPWPQIRPGGPTRSTAVHECHRVTRIVRVPPRGEGHCHRRSLSISARSGINCCPDTRSVALTHDPGASRCPRSLVAPFLAGHHPAMKHIRPALGLSLDTPGPSRAASSGWSSCRSPDGFHIIWNGEPRFMLIDDRGAATRVLIDPVLARPFGGARALNISGSRLPGEPAPIGLRRSGRSRRVGHGEPIAMGHVTASACSSSWPWHGGSAVATPHDGSAHRRALRGVQLSNVSPASGTATSGWLAARALRSAPPGGPRGTSDTVAR